jgi:glycosyltransferase involved in cell wall biosynthesis
LAAALAERGDEVHVLTSAVAGAVEQRDGPVRVHRVIRDWSLSRRERHRANALLRSTEIDVVHVLFPDSELQDRFLLPAALGFGAVPLVTTWWSLGLGRRSPAGVRIESLALLARSSVLTSHDPRYLRVLRRLRAGRRAEWLPVGNNLRQDGALPGREEARATVGLEPDVAWLGYFGQLDATRGAEDLFAALALAREDRDVRLVMIGSAGRPERYASEPSSAQYLARILEIPKELGVAAAIRWTDFLPDQHVLLYLRAVDLCVLPYRRNSIGRSALAATLEVGTPVVLGGSPEWIAPLVPGEHVALVPPASPHELATVLLDLLDAPKRRTALAEGASAAARFFAWPAIAETAASAYRTAASR